MALAGNRPQEPKRLKQGERPLQRAEGEALSIGFSELSAQSDQRSLSFWVMCYIDAP